MNAIEQLKSVLCDPEGRCCITGSDEDRAIVDRALEALAKQEQRCEYCDGTGDVHDQTGEWRGVCVCEAGTNLKENNT